LNPALGHIKSNTRQAGEGTGKPSYYHLLKELRGSILRDGNPVLDRIVKTKETKVEDGKVVHGD